MLSEFERLQQEQDADLTRALLDADPAYRTWSDARHAADAMTFDEWLDNPEGRAWLNEEAELARFKRNGFHDLEAWDYAAGEPSWEAGART